MCESKGQDGPCIGRHFDERRYVPWVAWNAGGDGKDCPDSHNLPRVSGWVGGWVGG